MIGIGVPAFIDRHAQFRSRTDQLPPKIKGAILACEIATRIVYRGGWEGDFETRLNRFVDEQFAGMVVP